jgi:DNA-binding transcriptional LysR family regulator
LADLGITYLDEVPSEFTSIELGTEGFHVVMPRQHRLAAKDGIRVEDLADAAMVSLPREAHTRKLLDGLASVAGFSLHHAVTVHQFATVMQCVRAGVGIAVVPGGAVPAAISVGLVSRPLVKPQFQRHMGILFLKDRALTPSAKGFLAHLESDWRSTPVVSLKKSRGETASRKA